MRALSLSTGCVFDDQVNQLDFKRVLENMVRPSEILTVRRRKKREGRAAAAATLEREAAGKSKMMKTMETLHQSTAIHFLDAVSHKLRERKFQIRDVFRDVDKARSGDLGKGAMRSVHVFYNIVIRNIQPHLSHSGVRGGRRSMRLKWHCIIAREDSGFACLKKASTGVGYCV